MKFYLGLVFFFMFARFSSIRSNLNLKPKVPKLDFSVKSDSYESLRIKEENGDSESRMKQKKYYNDLLKYMLDHGAKFRKFTEKFVTDSNRYIQATQDIKKNEIIAIIPLDLMISTLNEDIKKHENNIATTGYEFRGFVTWFLDVKKHTENEYYKHYLNIIPNDMTNIPVLFEKEQDLKLLSTSKILREALLSEKSIIKLIYEEFQRKSLIEKNVSFKEFAIAYEDFSTRNFHFYDNKNKEHRTLIPLVDLFNYDAKTNMVDWKYFLDRKEFVIWSMNDIEKGKEILLRYGHNHGNYHFFNLYGFTTKTIHFEDLILKHQGFEIKLYNKLSGTNFQRTTDLIISQQRKLKALSTQSDTKRSALNLLISAIEEYSSEYLSSQEEDEKRLETEKSFNQQNLLRFLINEKKVFNFYKNQAILELKKLNAAADSKKDNKLTVLASKVTKRPTATKSKNQTRKKR